MRLFITGICGFTGSTLTRALLESREGLEIFGLDNFIRAGSGSNIEALKKLGVRLFHGDVRAASDFEALPPADWVIDCAANPSVLAGVDGRTSSRQLVEHNLGGTTNLLEYCRQNGASFILLSTSRVYSIPPLAGLAVVARDNAFAPNEHEMFPDGLSLAGVAEGFSTAAPVSLYGATKLASEALALEYAATYGFSAYVNRCGVMAGAGQFGRADQGIFAFWINSWARKRPLAFIGFEGSGHQVRDCLHPADLAPLLLAQMDTTAARPEQPIVNVGGGTKSAKSLRQISQWCQERFGPHEVTMQAEPRPFDVPWMVLDHARASAIWNWAPIRTTESIMDEIAAHAEANPNWLDLSAPL